MNRKELVAKIQSAKKELKTAGTIHKRDLTKHIHRMEKELWMYDRYHKTA